jgi:aldehyde dehydrogenase (NAD+)
MHNDRLGDELGQTQSPSDRWKRLSAKQRCRIVAAVAAQVCERSGELIEACASDQRTDPVETVTGELLPLAAALKFLGKRGGKILAPRHVGWNGRPLWLFGVRSTVSRVPLGRVLILGTWNYPILLPGVQIAQALAAGNQVQLKPAQGAERGSEILVECFYRAGVPRDHLILLDSSTRAATLAISRGVDLVVLTGSAETGRKVLQSAAPTLSASIMELSGCDAVIVLPGFAPTRLVAALEFGLRFNSSATCIGPRRLLLGPEEREPVLERLKAVLADHPPVTIHAAARRSVADQIRAALASGAIDLLGRYSQERLERDGQMHPILLDRVTEDQNIASADLFAPVLSIMTVNEIDDVVRIVNRCPYRLAASVFGPTKEALQIARRLDVGTVTLNDLIAPTADPRLPFGGRGQSGFGVTRGQEGLLAMTAAKVVSARRGPIAPHLRPRSQADQEMLHGVLHLLHGGDFRKKLAGLRRMAWSVKKDG